LSNSEVRSSTNYVGYDVWNDWEELFRYTPNKADYFSGETSGLAMNGAHALEIGFGSGEFLQWSADRGARVNGTEINAVLPDAARELNITLLDSDPTHSACLSRSDLEPLTQDRQLKVVRYSHPLRAKQQSSGGGPASTESPSVTRISSPFRHLIGHGAFVQSAGDDHKCEADGSSHRLEITECPSDLESIKVMAQPTLESRT
jgi:hypothetical protein